MVRLLVRCGEISFEESAVFIDGTKIEANANRYSIGCCRNLSSISFVIHRFQVFL